MSRAKSSLATLFALLIVASWALPAMAQGQIQVAIVDMERAINESAQGKKASLQLKQRHDKLQAELKALGDELQNLRKDLENSAMVLKPEAKLAKEREFERKARLFNDRNRDVQQELGEAQRDIFRPIFMNMTKLIQDMGTKGGYSVILESKMAIYYPKSSDITGQVIAAYDKLHP